jgi:hypothetical protein
MKEIAIIRSSLDINDPTYVLADPVKNILNILKERFEKKCYGRPGETPTSGSSMYVDEVLEIVSHTEPQISQLGNSVQCHINNIEFKVSAVRCTQGEILNGCSVGQLVSQSGLIILRRQPCMHIAVPATEDAKAIGERKYMSVIVHRADHKYGKSIIVINATPLFGFIKTPAFRVNIGGMSSMNFNVLKGIYSEKFKEEDEELEAIGRDKDDYARRERMRGYLYGCKDTSRREEIPAGCKVISVRDLMDQTKVKSGWYFRSVLRDMDSEDVFFCEEEKNIPKEIAHETRIHGQDALSAMMRHYHQGMVLLREWTFIYKGENEKTHGNLWKILAKNKI